MAKLAAARGMLPLGPEEALEALRLLSDDGDDEVRQAASSTLRTFDAARLRSVVENPEAAPSVLDYLSSWKWLPREIYQPLILHKNIPDAALVRIATTSELGDVIELVSLKQQSLIQRPEIIEAILANPRRTPEAERRAREVRQEFFEKEYGAQVVAGEQRAQAGEPDEVGAAPETTVFVDDLAQFIEADLVETGEALYEQFLVEHALEEESLPDFEQPAGFDLDSFFESEEFAELHEEQDLFEERVSVLVRILNMNVKDRIRFAIKGTREVRMILIRDPNRPVCAAVIANPRITDHEIEMISSLRSVHEEVLRLIGTNRNWVRSYNVIHNLVRNPKTPVGLSLNFLNRIQTRDLRLLGQNKNIPEVVRTMASRTYLKRQHG